MSYVYLVQAEDGPVKIGVTNDLDGRMSGLQTGTPMELKLRYFVECFTEAVAYRLEKLLHERYQEFLVRGEWFNVDPERVFKDIQFARSLYPLCNALQVYIISESEDEVTEEQRYLPEPSGRTRYGEGRHSDPFRPTAEAPHSPIVQQSVKPVAWHRVTGGENGT